MPGDGLTKDEWRWLRERHGTGFAEIPEKVLTPTMIWSDQMVYGFLPDYIETKRWSAHQAIIEFAKERRTDWRYLAHRKFGKCQRPDFHS